MIYIDDVRLLTTGNVQAFDSLGITQDVAVGGTTLGGTLPLPLSCFLVGTPPFSGIPGPWKGSIDSALIFAVINAASPSLKILLDWVFSGGFPGDARQLLRLRVYGYTVAGGTIELLLRELKLDWFIDSMMSQSGMFLMTGHDRYIVAMDVWTNGDSGWDAVQYLDGGFTARVVG